MFVAVNCRSLQQVELDLGLSYQNRIGYFGSLVTIARWWTYLWLGYQKLHATSVEKGVAHVTFDQRAILIRIHLDLSSTSEIGRKGSGLASETGSNGVSD